MKTYMIDVRYLHLTSREREIAHAAGTAARRSGVRGSALRRAMARAIGIELTPDGVPLYERDAAPWVELGKIDLSEEWEREQDEQDEQDA